jgi:hypothetical protein
MTQAVEAQGNSHAHINGKSEDDTTGGTGCLTDDQRGYITP